MRVPSNLLNTVVFIGAVTNRQQTDLGEQADMNYAGTGFWVSVNSANGGKYCYLVTARHVAESLQDLTWGIRGNTVSGQAEIWEYEDEGEDHWHYHSDPNVDIAVLPWALPNEGAVTFNRRSFVSPNTTLLHRETKEYLPEPFGIGDEVAIVGLLRPIPGESTNMPIVRIGNLSMVPSEPIPWKENGKEIMITAYLIESRSISGLSGSPVYIQIGSKSTPNEANYFLLGMVRGHWDKGNVNVGIAAVEQATHINEMLDKPELVNIRRKLDKEFIGQGK